MRKTFRKSHFDLSETLELLWNYYCQVFPVLLNFGELLIQLKYVQKLTRVWEEKVLKFSYII